MKIIFALTVAFALCTMLQAKNRIVTERDGEGNATRVIELRDTLIDGKAVADTLSITTYEESAADSQAPTDEYAYHYGNKTSWHGFASPEKITENLIEIVGIVFIFGLPVFIVLIVLFFRYKNRKAKYRLAEQIVASGQPLPENFFKSTASITEDIRTKGIKNVFMGIGLFIFLWAITNRFAIGCIGLLIMFTGFGQLVIYYTQQKKEDTSPIGLRKTESAERNRYEAAGIESPQPEQKSDIQEDAER